MRGNIRERKPGVWQIEVELPRDPLSGKRRQQWRTVHGTKRKAQYELQKMLLEAQDKKNRASSASLSTYLGQWLEWKESRLSPSTLQTYSKRAEALATSPLGGISLDELSGAHIDRLYASMSKRGSSYYVLRQVHVVLRSALEQATKWGYLDRNPAKQASLPPAPTIEMAVPSVDQLVRILSEARASHPQWEAMIALAALTGLRRGELCALRWSDLHGSDLLVQRALVYTRATGIQEGPTKTRQSRSVSLAGLARAIIARQQEDLISIALGMALPLAGDPFLFFGDPDGGTPLHPDSVSKVFRRIADKFGWREIHFHSLRHFSATQLIAAGVDVRTVAGRLGHSDPSITLRVYSHLLESKNQEAAEIMDRLLDPDRAAVELLDGRLGLPGPSGGDREGTGK
ncbi:MAG: tyrosine-type recombinase/integrase [Ferrimicrobium sp.]